MRGGLCDPLRELSGFGYHEHVTGPVAVAAQLPQYLAWLRLDGDLPHAGQRGGPILTTYGDHPAGRRGQVADRGAADRLRRQYLGRQRMAEVLPGHHLQGTDAESAVDKVGDLAAVGPRIDLDELGPVLGHLDLDMGHAQVEPDLAQRVAPTLLSRCAARRRAAMGSIFRSSPLFALVRPAPAANQLAAQVGGSAGVPLTPPPAQSRSRASACLQGNFRLGHEHW